ncbi:hypothetical protein Zmor_016410 [Zophobas morio]|uniref:DUF4417 domain-containing protein n=1 Tax=Zophobas morio TaxID=2755281 RepID=A0AA38HI54_9CUCU|nr:DUF4417 domain-containing protein [Lactococcus formosensis]KAJ3615448.1 hypothetical protein Zmor_016410 [Zophobas morio]MDG6128698.1 DUF4417 domain-containing protein [Lactococcus formosensis]
MNERLRTDFSYNLQLLENVELSDDWLQMPIIKASKLIPSSLIGFNYAKTAKEFNKGVHFYIDDYQFERLWNSPERYIELLKKFQVVFTPDFSLYMDMPKPIQIYNIYRSRLLGAYWQSEGINVIPTLSWSDENSYDFAFDGIEKGSVVTVSTVGVLKSKEAKKYWISGMKEAIKRIKPKAIILYGQEIEFDYGDIKVIKFKNTNTERFGN